MDGIGQPRDLVGQGDRALRGAVRAGALHLAGFERREAIPDRRVEVSRANPARLARLSGASGKAQLWLAAFREPPDNSLIGSVDQLLELIQGHTAINADRVPSPVPDVAGNGHRVWVLVAKLAHRLHSGRA